MHDRLRVLVTCDWFSPATGGGAERVAYEVVRRLAERGHRITVLATRPDRQLSFDLDPRIDLVTVRAYDLAPIVRAQVSVAPYLIVATSEVVRQVRPDVVWSHSLQFQTTLFAALSPPRRGTPFVVSAHVGDLTAVPGMLGVTARLHEQVVGRTILRLATRAIAVSTPVGEHLQRLSPGLATDIVPNGVDTTRFRPRDPIRRPVFRIGFLGRLIANKGPDVAVRALAEAIRRGVGVSLSIVGVGPERRRLEQLAAELGISGSVSFEGYRADPENWYHEIDAVVRPSRTEGMPLGVLEAMASGIPVIASDIPGNRSVLRDNDNGLLVPVGDVRSFAVAIARIVSDSQLRTRLVRHGLAATRTHTWENTTDLTEATLLTAAAARQGTASVAPRSS